MASVIYKCGESLRDIYNSDDVLKAGGFTFVLRKLPWAPDESWKPGAWVWPINPPDPNHENTIDHERFLFGVSLSRATDGDLVSGQSLLLTALERAYDLLHNKSASNLPATVKALNLDLKASFAAGEIPDCCVTGITSRSRQLFLPGAFSKGFDVCSFVVEFSVLKSRLSAEDL